MAGADRATSAILAGQQLHRADIMPLPTQYLHHDVNPSRADGMRIHRHLINPLRQLLHALRASGHH